MLVKCGEVLSNTGKVRQDKVVFRQHVGLVKLS